MKLTKALVLCSAFVLTLAPADAATIADGLYVLDNHDDGSARPPLYGFRLDGLTASGIHTFSFDTAIAGVGMNMAVNAGAGTIAIFGTAWGGVDNGSGYTSPTFWDISFVYNTVLPVPGDDDLYVVGATGTGTITDGTDTYNLVAKSNGSFAFRLGDEGDDNGHRGEPGISGWGWVNHALAPTDPSTVPHIAASDWLFTASPSGGPGIIPTPAAFGAGLLGLAGLALRRAR
ncbi:MAG: hypothetical protein RIG82_07960 [Phycisphaeraceae bacterium]